ncbi:hypothetical protein O4328_35200, partial [Rhodococcus opacus]
MRTLASPILTQTIPAMADSCDGIRVAACGFGRSRDLGPIAGQLRVGAECGLGGGRGRVVVDHVLPPGIERA